MGFCPLWHCIVKEATYCVTIHLLKFGNTQLVYSFIAIRSICILLQHVHYTGLPSRVAFIVNVVFYYLVLS